MHKIFKQKFCASSWIITKINNKYICFRSHTTIFHYSAYLATSFGH